MAFDGNGNYVRIHNWTQDAANGLDINAGEMDAEDNSIQGAFNITVTRDGQGKMAADFLPSAAGTYNLGTGGAPWLNIAAKSGVIGPPAAGVAWTVTQVNGSPSFGCIINGNATAGSSFGLLVQAGTNATDNALIVRAQNGTNLLQVFGDGGVTIDPSVTSTDLGPGTLNVKNGISINSQPLYVGIPQNAQAGNYNIVLTDANKHLFFSGVGAKAVALPGNATVPFPIGTAITLVNPTGAGVITLTSVDTLEFFPSGGSGTRTMAASSQATLLKINTTAWSITGVGVS